MEETKEKPEPNDTIYRRFKHLSALSKYKNNDGGPLCLVGIGLSALGLKGRLGHIRLKGW